MFFVSDFVEPSQPIVTKICHTMELCYPNFIKVPPIIGNFAGDVIFNAKEFLQAQKVASIAAICVY